MQLPLSRLFALTTVLAILVAVPRLRLEMREWLVLPTILVHQIFCATFLGFVLWRVTGRRLVVGLAVCLIIAVIWLPFTIDITQHLISGDPTIVYHATESVGLTDEYGRLWYHMCNAFDYQMTIATD
jgi:hypothetical protein